MSEIKNLRKIIPILVALLVCAIVTGCGNNSNVETTPSPTSEVVENASTTDDVLEKVIENTVDNLKAYDSALTLYYHGLDLCDQFINGDIPLATLADELRIIRDNLSSYSGIIANDELKAAAFSEERLDGELAMGEFIDTIIQDFSNELDAQLQFLEAGTYNYSKTFLHEKVDVIRSLAANYTELAWYTVNEYFAGLDREPDALKECAAALPNFADISSNWSHDDDVIQKQQELRWSQLDALLQKEAVMTGDMRIDLNESKAADEEYRKALIASIMEEYGVSEEIAEELVELNEAKQELEILKQQMRDKFAPSEENDSGTLFGKAAKFARVKMYEEASECIDVFLSKEDDPEYPKICGETIKALYDHAEESGLDYGVIVLVLSDGDDYYHSGDIIIEIDGTPIYGEQEYIDTSDLRADGFEAVVMRLNSDGELEEVTVSVPADAAPHFTGRQVRES